LKNLLGRNGRIDFHNCAACKADPKIAEISAIEDPSERARRLFEYLEDWVPPGERKPPSPTVSDDSFDGPILSDAMAEIEQQAQQFHAVATTKEAAKPLDQRHMELVQSLTFICTRMSRAQVENRLGKAVRENFKDYGEVVQAAPVKARILNFLAQGIRGVLADPYASEAIDAFDETQLSGFLSEHDALVREYYPDALRGAKYETATDPETLVREVPQKLAAAREVLASEEAQSIFAPSVSDTLEMLYRREEGARRGYLTASDDAAREEAGKELQRLSVQITAYLGKIKGRLVQWQVRAGQWTQEQVDYAKEHPLAVGGGVASLGGGVLYVVGKLTPVFEGMWKLIGSLPLPF
jgi:hypothetical protein